jgi:hypothetical protein
VLEGGSGEEGDTLLPFWVGHKKVLTRQEFRC